jgi:hypothetical protein
MIWMLLNSILFCIWISLSAHGSGIAGFLEAIVAGFFLFSAGLSWREMK